VLVDEAVVARMASPRLVPARPRRLLVLNWRDITHPRAGGAEKVTHEIARRWVTWGHQVTMFCASYRDAAPEESIDGVAVVRRGRQQTVHLEAFRHYRRLRRGRYDLVIDQINTIPFFTPLYAREPVLMFSHQLAREVWHYEAPWPASAAGYLAEPFYLRVYRHTPIMTVSQSTKDDLRSLGLAGPCYIIPEAVDTKAPERLPPMETKEPSLTLVSVGRVVPSKRVDHLIRTLKRLHEAGLVQARLWIIGPWDEKYRRRLDCCVAALGLANHVTFFGRVDAASKENLLARAHVLVMASVREGWGLAVTEANVLGTPAIVYNVPGLRDSTRDGETGLVCQDNYPSALAQAVASLHADAPLYARVRHRAWAMARELNWDQTARAAWNAVEACL
jgi:glycosyltransferase involved in cell wall biosynthesis